MMFTEEKLEKWIDALEEHIGMDESFLIRYETNKPLYDGIVERKANLEDLKQTLEQIYTSMNSDNSI